MKPMDGACDTHTLRERDVSAYDYCHESARTARLYGCGDACMGHLRTPVPEWVRRAVASRLPARVSER